jgi:ribonuclease-3
LLIEALTHRSVQQAGTKDRPAHYERLEFLGDRVLGLVIADLLLQRFPEEPEGILARRLTDLVRAETLADVARGVCIGPYLVLGKGEQTQGRDNKAILADVCEAIIGAIYRDGGIEPVFTFIQREWAEKMEETAQKPPKDAKTCLQEWAQARSFALPKYEITARSGPAHDPVFTVQVSVGQLPPGSATGKSKRVAEQAAAKKLLQQIQETEQ